MLELWFQMWIDAQAKPPLQPVSLTATRRSPLESAVRL